jgi:hypothetical protein
MEFKIHIRCINEPRITDALYEGQTMTFQERTLWDAVWCTLEHLADEILAIKDKPKDVLFELSGVAHDGELAFYQGHVKYEPYEWAKIYEGDSSLFNEEGVEPYSMDIKPIKPTKAEADFVQILTDAFPEYEFKYGQDSFYCRLGSEWVNIFDSIKELPETEEERYWKTLPGLQTNDGALSGKYAGYKMMRGLVERVRGNFFKQQRVDLIINRIPTFTEFLEL